MLGLANLSSSTENVDQQKSALFGVLQKKITYIGQVGVCTFLLMQIFVAFSVNNFVQQKSALARQ